VVAPLQQNPGYAHGRWGHVVFAEASRSFSLAAILGAICYGAALVDMEAPRLKT